MKLCHDDAKDKEMEIEMSWVSEETNRKHQFVPQELIDQAQTELQSAQDAMQEWTSIILPHYIKCVSIKYEYMLILLKEISLIEFFSSFFKNFQFSFSWNYKKKKK